ncbi:MAG TPA: hypothetical protein VLE96_05020 [Chlamydiales bacterium]|nr:hypothetical protein [Chlamydiales bacterium]
MKITPRLLSIPPYLSTSWSNISSIQLQSKNERSLLIVTLKCGTQVEIPSMAQSDIDEIFQAHAAFHDGEPASLLKNSLSFTLPLKSTEEGAVIDPLNATMQHNPEQSDLPPIPGHVLEKIGSIVKSFGLENTPFLEQTVANCNCIYCQLARSLRPQEEIIDEADLKFRDWEVTQVEEKLYHVVNPIDKNEYYDVFLGEPIGCTCGSKNCEHICAVLNT